MGGEGGPAGNRVLGVESTDPMLSFLGAMGLAQVAGTALVVDMCHDLHLRSDRTLADIAADGPSLGELSPGRSGVAIISSGPLPVSRCREVVETLEANWPALVVRCARGQWEGPTVPVRPLLPGLMQATEPFPAVWQPWVRGLRPPGPGPVLPEIRSATVRRMLAGRAAPRSRWVRAWSRVWGMPWA